jgi:hypothetical protein
LLTHFDESVPTDDLYALTHPCAFNLTLKLTVTVACARDAHSLTFETLTLMGTIKFAHTGHIVDGIASAHIEELSAALPGFAEAMAWPC